MKAMEMIAYYVLGIPDLIDDICDKFDCVDLDTEYLKDIIEECSYRNLKNVGSIVIKNLYTQIIDDAIESYGFDADKFSFYIDGDYSELKYNGISIKQTSDIERLSNN